MYKTRSTVTRATISGAVPARAVPVHIALCSCTQTKVKERVSR